ncbi:MAG: ornithine cyclodeaminase [Bacteroidota bacterium]
MPPSPIPYYSARDLAEKISMEKAIKLMAATFRQISSGEAQVPVRAHIFMPEEKGQSLFMPAYLAGNKQFGVKVVGIHDENPQKGLPYIHAIVLVMDAANGKPLALVDGTYLTALRTGAASGLATQLLAREDAKTLAVFGAGVQARTQIEAVLAVRQIKEILLFNRTAEKARLLKSEVEEKYRIPCKLAAEEEVEKADIICTATSSSTPVFNPSHLKTGPHINAIGAYRKDMVEIPAQTVCNSSVFVDQLSATWEEAGDIIQPFEAGLITQNHIKGEIGQIVSGQIAGRTSNEEITLFKSVGNAAQDIAVAGALLKE